MGMLHTLESKLKVLSPINPETVPSDLVTMNSLIVFRDLDKNETHELRLVYQLAPFQGNQVSVMAPLGTALLGSREKLTVTYEDRFSQLRKIQIEEIKTGKKP